MNAVAFRGHEWITDGKLHYDAECPEGEACFFEMPIFKRALLSHAQAHRQAA